MIPVESYLMKLQESLVRNGVDAEVSAVREELEHRGPTMRCFQMVDLCVQFVSRTTFQPPLQGIGYHMVSIYPIKYFVIIGMSADQLSNLNLSQLTSKCLAKLLNKAFLRLHLLQHIQLLKMMFSTYPWLLIVMI